MLQAAQFPIVERRKKLVFFLLCGGILALAIVGAIRWIVPLNDFIVKPHYARALTVLMMQELSKAIGDRSPVILLGEDDQCFEVVKPADLLDNQISGFLLTLTFSERNRFSCITTNAVPSDPRFPRAREIKPGEGEMYGGARLLQPIAVIPVSRSVHVYSPEYLEMLNWRVRPKFPLSQEQTSKMTVRHYGSGGSEKGQGQETAGIDLDFDKARALVAASHRRFNLILDVCLAMIVCVLLVTSILATLIYKTTAQYLRLYGGTLGFATFVRQDLDAMVVAIRSSYINQQQEATAQLRKQELWAALKEHLEHELRSSLTRISDPEMQKKIQECLAVESPAMDRMKELLEEAHEVSGRRTPAEKVAHLLESLKSYCSEDEYTDCCREAEEALERFGFKAARTIVVAQHDRFKLRAREMESSQLDPAGSNESLDDSPERS